MEQTLEQTLEQTPPPACRYSGKNGGVAIVLLVPSVSSLAGRSTTAK